MILGELGRSEADLAALRDAVFSLSAKNLRGGGVISAAPDRARVQPRQTGGGGGVNN